MFKRSQLNALKLAPILKLCVELCAELCVSCASFND